MPKFPKYSEYLPGLRAVILDKLHETENRARNYEESCRIRKVGDGRVPAALRGNIQIVRDCIKSDQMIDPAICALICMGLEDFADELWGDIQGVSA